MRWKILPKLFRKVTDMIAVVMNTTEPCKAENCFNDAWQEGYCKECANYFLMKEAVAAIQENNQLLLGIAKNNNPPTIFPNPGGRTKSPQTIITEENQPFIPQIETHEHASRINVTTTTAQKDIQKLSQKLHQAKNLEGQPK